MQNIKIQLADDSTLVRNNMVRLLKSIKNIQISQSNDFDSTISMLSEIKPDILLLDIRMPNGSGYDILDFLKKECIKSIIIILTNYATEENRQKAFDKGADYFFDKSKEHRSAIKKIQQIVEERCNE